MYGPREVLNELKWSPQGDLSHAEIFYIHRGAPNDTRVIRGDAVVDLHASFMEVRAPRAPGGTSMIPYHRVFRIDRSGTPVWARRQDARNEHAHEQRDG